MRLSAALPITTGGLAVTHPVIMEDKRGRQKINLKRPILHAIIYSAVAEITYISQSLTSIPTCQSVSSSILIACPGLKALLSSLSKVKYDFLYDNYHVCCQESWRSLPHRQAYTTFIMVALFLLPLAAMLFLYTRIGIELWIRKRVGDSSVLNTMNHREISKISR